MTVRPLIEQWFPAAVVGAESLRERGSAKAYPPINFLHVWWARRPLAASRAAVLASLLPAWPTKEEASADDEAAHARDALLREFADEEEYRSWFLQAIGITGDPVLGRMRIAAARESGERLEDGGYGYPRAFTVSPDAKTIARVGSLARIRDGSSEVPAVVDPFSGGGSIPFEAARYGFSTLANELNPVAAAILHGTVRLPAELGAEFANVIKVWGGRWAARVKERLSAFFPMGSDEKSIAAYIWAHTVPCPTTGRPTPLAPDYWLARGKAGRDVAVKLDVDGASGAVAVEVIQGKAAAEFGTRSTYKRGVGTSIWTGETFGGEYIREQANGGRLSETLLALSVVRSTTTVRQFRTPTQDDADALVAAKGELARLLPQWEVDDVVPTEAVTPGDKTDEPRRMGVTLWRDFFAPRQLLTAAIAAEELRRVVAEAEAEIGSERARALNLCLAFAFDRAISHDCRFATFDSSRAIVRSLFVRHDFGFKWTFAEFDGARVLIPWAVNHAVINHKKICDLVVSKQTLLDAGRAARADIAVGSATGLPLPSESVDSIVTDPPYYDNVMYAELSDFFYVWLKRTLRDTWPELTSQVLTDKDDEAVANGSLFRSVATFSGRGRRPSGAKTADELADEHYERLLTQSFREAHRVLKPGGVMTVMFTHKRVDAWDTLGQALLESGFSINSSWPVHTESEHSLNQAKKNAASSTIFLTCRKRGDTTHAYWADIRADVVTAARQAATELAEDGLVGIDLTLATFGPVLSVLSRSWPVYTGELDADGNPQVLRPDAALDLAREEVARLKKRGLLGGRDVEFDRVTDWYLLAWSDFAAAEFPYDEARKLSIATHLELDDLSRQHGLIRAASGNVTLLTPAQRRTARSLDPDAATWPTMIDALHALMLTYDEEGLPAARAWLERTGKGDDQRFADLVGAALHAIPRVKDKGEFARPEARTLEGLRATLFEQIPAPAEPEEPGSAQAALFE